MADMPGSEVKNVPHRQLMLRRDPLGHFCLHDVLTGMPLAGQVAVNVEQIPFDVTTVTVKFSCDPRCDGHVIIVGDDRG